MSELQQFFQETMSGQITALEVALESLASSDHRGSDAIRRIAHSLWASAAGYGFPEVSDQAEEVDRAEDDDLADTTRRLIDLMTAAGRHNDRPVVLAVDDDPLIRRLLETKLAGPDRAVRTAEDVASAEEVIRSGRVSVIVLDLFLPDADGRTLLGELRLRSETATTPIFVITGSTGLLTRAECLALGADAVLEKPFDPDGLATMVGAALRMHRRGSGARSTLRDAAGRRFTSLTAADQPVTIGSVLPETHGPGGTSEHVADESLSQHIAEAIAAEMDDDSVVGAWSPAEIIIVAGIDVERLAAGLDRARLHLRNLPHPARVGAIASFSAGIADGYRGATLTDAYAQARNHALRARDDGGDRVERSFPREDLSRVLLAEDDPLTAALVVHRLERAGYQVHHCADGIEALEELANSAYPLAVLDVQMPKLDGFGVLAQIRGHADLESMKVIMLTAVGAERDVVRGFELGADDYILKPFSPAELTARVRRLLDRA